VKKIQKGVRFVERLHALACARVAVGTVRTGYFRIRASNIRTAADVYDNINTRLPGYGRCDLVQTKGSRIVLECAKSRLSPELCSRG